VKRILLERLQDRFGELVESYLAEHDMTQGELAKRVNLQRTHLNALVNGKRSLSAYYVLQFIRAGVFSMAEIYDHDPETRAEEEFWALASEAENHALLRKIAQLRKRGVDVDLLLNMIDPDKTPKK